MRAVDFFLEVVVISIDLVLEWAWYIGAYVHVAFL